MPTPQNPDVKVTLPGGYKFDGTEVMIRIDDGDASGQHQVTAQTMAKGYLAYLAMMNAIR
jgi:hypothetical protein